MKTHFLKRNPKKTHKTILTLIFVYFGVLVGSENAEAQPVSLNQCTTTGLAGTPVPIPTDAFEIEYPAGINCPFVEDGNSIVIGFGNTILTTRPSRPTKIAQSTSIPPGTYTVELFAWDSYEYRGNQSVSRVTVGAQEEVYFVTFQSEGTEVARSSRSSDVPDYIDPGHWQGIVDESLVIPQQVDRVSAETPSDGSVMAGCMRLTEVQSSCGDGVTTSGEDCDGESYCSDSCRIIQCQNSTCGDGVHDPIDPSTGAPNEQCDDGNDDNNDSCSNTCRLNNPCADNDADGFCDLCINTSPSGQCLDCTDADFNGVCDVVNPVCAPGSADPNCTICPDINGNGVCEPECQDQDSDGFCDQNAICGPANNGTFIGLDPPEKCSSDQYPVESELSLDGTISLWRCENSLGQRSEQCAAVAACQSGQYQCNGSCETLAITGTNRHIAHRGVTTGTTQQAITSSDGSCLE